ncbi:MAG: hypothetical protein U9R17_11370 [Thermodesulfobacteriota bacterium]|nr:hypothetical protein [Thermodesulfobacteriota bacterium]
MNLFPLPCWCANKEPKTVVFSLNVKDELLKEALKKISKSTGYEITVSENWENLPVTAQFKNETVEDGLNRLLRGLNHSLVIEDTEKKISIKIVSRSSNIQATEHTALPNYPQKQLDPGDIEVAPPKNPGERGLTQRELDAIIAAQEKIDPGDIEVIPPEKPGDKGITQRELDAIIAEQEKIDSGDIEVIPPKSPGERGITQREIDAIRALRQKDNETGVKLAPPKDSKQ